MLPARGERIFGVETEFGCLVADESLGSPELVVEAIKDYIFYDLRLGAIDLHPRDMVFEPAHSGGFMLNGSRLYIDAVGSHLEYATAECRTLRDVVANDRAGQRHIVRAIHDLGLTDSVSVYNNAIDHFGGHTFGCHENYLLRDDDLLNSSAHLLYPFLVTRQIYAGIGRVGGHVLSGTGFRPKYEEIMENPVDFIWVSHVYGVFPDPSVKFQLSQRADHIIKAMASRVRFNRALINPKWEHYYSHEGCTRLHLLFGESNQNEYAYALKVGATCLALRLLEDHLVPETLDLAQPIAALREISRDEDFRWNVTTMDGDRVSAIEIQRQYLRLAQRYRGDSPDVDWTLSEWENTLDGLEKDPLSMGDRLDWVAKREIVEQYRRELNVEWGDELHSVDLEYHNIDPTKSLFYAYQEMGKTRRAVDDGDIVGAMSFPPDNTRAKGRAALVERVLKRRHPRNYTFDWNAATIGNEVFDLSDPFTTYA